MTDKPHRIIDISLDERTVVRRSPDIEHERAVAIYDLLEENHFCPKAGDPGPYAVQLAVQEDRLLIEIKTQSGRPVDTVGMSLRPFRRIVKDYFTVCESYYAAIKSLPPSQIEAIDMGRRGLHNEGSEMLRDRLADRVEIDFDTARRLFTLVCVLHLKG